MLALMAPILIILLFSAILRTAGFHIDAPTQLYTPALAQSNAPTPSDPLVLTDGQGNHPLGLHMELLEDPSGKLSIDDVSSPAFASRFTPSQVAVPNYGYTNSAYWLRMRLRNEASLVNLWLLEVNFQNLNYVDLYIPSQGGGYNVKQSGALRPFATRELPYYHVVFELPLAYQDEQTPTYAFRAALP